ncbi:Prolyl endopeptidase [Minicystis rosea]|nr:Prolyl endopeptidase [Minicystis rosea]
MPTDSARRPDPSTPPTRREPLVEHLHGVPVADPYRWLEDGESAEVRAWSRAQTDRTEQILAARPDTEALRARLEALLRIGTVEPPVVAGPKGGPRRYFHRRQAPDRDQPTLYVRDGVDGVDRPLIDPNDRSPDGTVALDWWAPSWDGRLLAYGISERGSEDSTLRVLDVDTGRDLPDTEVIPRARYASIAWLPDGSGFYYSRYPARGAVPAGEEHYHRAIYEHRIGRSAAEDPHVFGAGRALSDMPYIDISPNGRWLLAMVHMGWSRRELYLLDRHAGPSATFQPIAVPEGEGFYEALMRDDHLLVRTNDGAPTFRLFRVDPERPERAAWREILPPSREVLAGVTEIGGDIVALYIRDACSVVKRFTADGTPKGEIALPTLGTVRGIHGEPDGSEAFFDFSSFAIPARVYRIDLTTGATHVWADVDAPIDPDAFLVEQEHAISRDGTVIPLFVTRMKGVPRDGRAPGLLTGYGGFSASQTPTWNGARYAFLERGGVCALANLRGGGEYGQAWHRAGMLEQKQNVFDDAIAVAEHMIASRLTSSDRLAVVGGSNGGLLVGALITQRPDLFRAAVCLVPLLDMLRYHRFLIARLWVPEYGSADDAAQFRFLHAYSPYHHVVHGTKYPAVLFATAESDTRVDPLHARKMAALMQWASDSDHPILLRIEGRAGHGAGKPISKRIDEAALSYAFLFWQLGLEPKAGAAESVAPRDAGSPHA